MGTSSSIDRRQGMAEVMANESELRLPTTDRQQPAATGSPKVNIRRKAPATNPSGRQQQATKSLNDGTAEQRDNARRLASGPPIPKRNIKLFEGNGPVTAWKKGSLVGKGATGAVYEATDAATQGVFCVKEIEFCDDFADNPHDLQRFEALKREIDLLKDIHHPNVVRFLGVDRVNFSIYIEMEYVYGGNIQDIVRNFGPLKEDTARKFTQQILNGLHYLHEKNIVHRDIKGANILVGVDGLVKLADFGAAKRALDTDELFKTLAGTPYWMAPEVVRQEGHNKAADVWSLGATVLQMLSGSAPYQSLPPVPALFKIGHSNECPVPELSGTPPWSSEASDFMRQCFTRDPTKRPTVKQLAQHNWFSAASASRRSRREKADPLPQSSEAEGQKARPEASTKYAEDSSATVVPLTATALQSASPNSVAPPAGDLFDKSSCASARELVFRYSQVVEDEVLDEEAQIEEFVAYVSERHRALQQEQLQCAHGIEDRHNDASHSNESSDGEYDAAAEEILRRASRGDGAGDDASSVSSSEQHDDQFPPEAAVGRSTSSNALSSTAAATNNARTASDASSSRPVAESPPLHLDSHAAPHPALRSHRLEDDDEEDDDTVAFDEFDEAHFDRIIAGLGTSHRNA